MTMFDLDRMAECDQRLIALEGGAVSRPIPARGPAPARESVTAPGVCPFSGQRREVSA